MTRKQFARRLGDQLTLIATMNGSPVGFATLANNETIDLLYVHRRPPGGAPAPCWSMRWRSLPHARGAKRLTDRRRATARRTSSRSAALSPQQRNTVMRGGEWLANTTMQKVLKETTR